MFIRGLGLLNECKRWVEVVEGSIEVPGGLAEVIEMLMPEDVQFWTKQGPHELIEISIDVVASLMEVTDGSMSEGMRHWIDDSLESRACLVSC
jgi:hypothetical protein